jgi:oligopeptidase B
MTAPRIASALKARHLMTASNPVLAKISAIAGHVFPAGSEEARAQDAMFGAFATWAAENNGALCRR